MAGGHTLIPTLKLRLASPALLIDITGIEELKGIEISDRIRIGALTTHAELLMSEPLRKVLPIFHQAADSSPTPRCAIAARSAARWQTPTLRPTGRRSWSP